MQNGLTSCIFYKIVIYKDVLKFKLIDNGRTIFKIFVFFSKSQQQQGTS